MISAVAMLVLFGTFFVADAGHCYSIQGGCEACIGGNPPVPTCGWCEGRCQMAADPCTTTPLLAAAQCNADPVPAPEPAPDPAPAPAPAPGPQYPQYHSAKGASTSAATCGSIRKAFTKSECCASGDASVTEYSVVPMSHKSTVVGENPCAGNKPVDAFKAGDGYFNNVDCTLADGVLNSLEQSGIEVTKGYKGDFNTTGREPITIPYWQAGLCPVNVHWHLGTEHKSKGEYDEYGMGPAHRRLAKDARKGFQCRKYDSTDPKFTTEYEWQHCVGMHVGETYEVHWPHSAAGACGTPHQYQTPFYDGVFCNGGIISLNPLNTYSKIGVQAQVFTIVNDESYFYPDLIRGMIVERDYGADIAKYTGSTTGTSRDNEICSRYTPITWQVDRKCHLISASTFDKMCADMKAQRDDMSDDLYAHGARELVSDQFAADNHNRRLDDHQRKLQDGCGPGDALCATSDAEPSPAPQPTPAPTPAPTYGMAKSPEETKNNPCWPASCDDDAQSTTDAPAAEIGEIAAAAPGEGRLLSYMGLIVAAWLV